MEKGNSYGLFGHASLRLDGRVFSFWLIEGRLTPVVMYPGPFFRLYNEYEERDVLGLELDVSGEWTEHLRKRVLRLLDRPRSQDPPYNVFRRNCVTGLVRLLSPGAKDLPPVHTVGALERWVRRSFGIVSERFYPSFRHRKMREKMLEGKALWREFIVPLSDCDSHRYACWRLVYTEDLRGGRALLRPLAGAGNAAAGVAQVFKGVLGVPFGKFPDVFRGLYSVALAVPELAGITVRFAGRPLPPSEDRREGPPPGWEPRKEKGRRKSSARARRTNRKRKVRPPLSPSASSPISR